MLKEEPRITILTQHSPVKRHGGYFIWVSFPPGVDSQDFFTYSMKEYGVRFMAGRKCDPFPSSEDDATGTSIQSCARLCFADLDRDELVKGTSEFLKAFRSYMKTIDE